MMEHMGGMMWGMGLVWVLSHPGAGPQCSALIKYLRSGSESRSDSDD